MKYFYILIVFAFISSGLKAEDWCKSEPSFSYTNIDKRIDELSKKYNKHAGADVAASFSGKTAVNYPFLDRAAKQLGLNNIALSNEDICRWTMLSDEEKQSEIVLYASQLQRVKNINNASSQLASCMSILTSHESKYSSIPTIAQAVALCAGEIGFLSSNENVEFFIGKGTWLGKLNVSATKEIKDLPTTPVYIIESCTAGKTKFHGSADGRSFSPIVANEMNFNSQGDVYFAYATNQGSAWIEQFAFTIVRTSNTKGSIQMLRTVSNKELAENEPLREFSVIGAGSLEKISDNCDILKYPEQ